MASLDSKRGELKDFLKRFRDFRDFEPLVMIQSNVERKLGIKPINFTINTSILTKKNTIAKT